jgi:AcrR family transcriptional regulator
MADPSTATVDLAPPSDVRSRIIEAAADLIAKGGRDAATTRSVALAAGVQAPTIYRLFGDKSGLLDAVAEHGLAQYVRGKALREPHPDPVQDLRDGWDLHIEFGLAHPGLFAIMAGDPQSPALSPAAAAGIDVLRRRVRNIALAGRLRVSETRAVALVHAIGVGTILTLLGQPEERRDLDLSDVARETAIAAIVSEGSPVGGAGPSVAATMLQASLDQTSVLSDGERHLMRELLVRIADRDLLSR